MTTSPRPIQSVNNTELYNRWAKVYDTDNNILQAIDDSLLPSLLTTALSTLSSLPPSSQSPGLTITELGCGTGRNTSKLLLQNAPIAQINALDLSPGMLNVARERCEKISASSGARDSPKPDLEFLEFDALNPEKFPAVRALEGQADLVLSTLVLEHLPIDVFFRTVKSLLKPSGGYLVLTNMHAEMGRRSQAGFMDPETGGKVQGMSFVYEVQEVVEEARRWGGEVLGSVGERAVEEGDLGGVVNRERGAKWIGCRVWFGCVLRLGGEGGEVRE